MIIAETWVDVAGGAFINDGFFHQSHSDTKDHSADHLAAGGFGIDDFARAVNAEAAGNLNARAKQRLSLEKGWLNWARVKGKTENDLMKLPFKKIFAFRIGFLKPDKDAKNTVKLYNYLGWLYPLVRKFSNKYASTLEEVGRAMINSVTKSYEKQILEVSDIIELSKR